MSIFLQHSYRIFQKARRILKRKLDCTTVVDDEEPCITLYNLSLSNSYTLSIDKILNNISKGVDTFW